MSYFHKITHSIAVNGTDIRFKLILIKFEGH